MKSRLLLFAPHQERPATDEEKVSAILGWLFAISIMALTCLAALVGDLMPERIWVPIYVSGALLVLFGVIYKNILGWDGLRLRHPKLFLAILNLPARITALFLKLWLCIPPELIAVSSAVARLIRTLLLWILKIAWWAGIAYGVWILYSVVLGRVGGVMALALIGFGYFLREIE